VTIRCPACRVLADREDLIDITSLGDSELHFRCPYCGEDFGFWYTAPLPVPDTTPAPSDSP
jgi:hypothetical protein